MPNTVQVHHYREWHRSLTVQVQTPTYTRLSMSNIVQVQTLTYTTLSMPNTVQVQLQRGLPCPRRTHHITCNPTATPEVCIRDEQVPPPEPHRPSSAHAKVNMRAYNGYTCTRTGSSTHVHKRGTMFKVVHAKRCTSTNTHVLYGCRSGCPCRTLYKYKYSVYFHAHVPTTIGVSLRLSMPNTVHIRV